MGCRGRRWPPCLVVVVILVGVYRSKIFLVVKEAPIAMEGKMLEGWAESMELYPVSAVFMVGLMVVEGMCLAVAPENPSIKL